jgi:DNA repair protein RecO (recombination protein O)
MSSRFFTTDALVIGSMRYGEADRIVQLYTRDRGRLGAIAKGVRRTKSKTGGRLEPFSLVRASLHSGRGSLYTVAGVETLRTFQGVRDELFRMEEGARLLAAIRRLFPGEEASVPAFNLLARGIAQLAECPGRAAAANLVLATRLKLLVLLGYSPEMDCCAACGSEGPFGAYSPSLGGLLCSACWAEGGSGSAIVTDSEAPGEGTATTEAAALGVRTATIGAGARGAEPCFGLSAGAVATLQVLIEKPLVELEGFDIDQRAAAEVEQVLTQTLAYHGH